MSLEQGEIPSCFFVFSSWFFTFWLFPLQYFRIRSHMSVNRLTDIATCQIEIFRHLWQTWVFNVISMCIDRRGRVIKIFLAENLWFEAEAFGYFSLFYFYLLYVLPSCPCNISNSRQTNIVSQLKFSVPQFLLKLPLYIF